MKNEEDFKQMAKKTANCFKEVEDATGNMNEFDRMMRESMAKAEKVAEYEQQKAREEQERLRVESLKQQKDILRREQ
jgi:hypothetical protein